MLFNGVLLWIIPNHFPQWAKVSAQITANHKGFFEFRLCPQNTTDLPASESCMDRCGCLLNAIILVSILLFFLLNLTTYFEKAYIDRAKFRFHNYYLHDLLWKGMFWRSAEVARVTCFPPAQVLKMIPGPCKLFSNQFVKYFLTPIKYFELLSKTF